MPHPSIYAKTTPDKAAFIMTETGETVTYLQLEEQSNQLAHLFRQLGLQAKDHIAILMENHIRFFPIVWAGMRSGLIITPISTHLLAEEVAYIINNCEAKLFITSKKYSELAIGLKAKAPNVVHHFMIDGVAEGFHSLENQLEDLPTHPIEDEVQGSTMLYSSGTTGLPKGVFTPPHSENIHETNPLLESIGHNFKFGPHVQYLSPAPLYHAAPMAYNMVNSMFGGTSLIMNKFEAAKSLEAIEKYKANYSQWVPIMFVRMLKLPKEDIERYDVSSMLLALHAAAPCPIEVKEKMIDWWGPVLFEYYGASEGNGLTAITSQEWLEHKGSVGKAFVGECFILDDDGNELPRGEIGNVYFKGGQEFKYHNEEEKTTKAYAKNGSSTVGDVGYMDKDGYLYLTDRKNFTIISGGVNIYPQEIENQIINHPKVADVAVFGIPHEEFGQEVKAVVQPKHWEDAGHDLEDELMAYCRERLAKIKVPRSIDFDEALPRKDNGKLYKRRLVERYQ
jgi:fatty-acyl-CoA synthase